MCNPAPLGTGSRWDLWILLPICYDGNAGSTKTMTAPQSSALLRLPDETLESILELASYVANEPQHAEHRASPTKVPLRGNWRVLPFVLTCRRLHSLAIPLLYRHVTVLKGPAANRFRRTVAQHPGLGVYLLTLDISVGQYRDYPTDVFDSPRLGDLLPTTPKLKELLLCCDFWDWNETLIQTLERCVPGLHSLVLTVPWWLYGDHLSHCVLAESWEKLFETSALEKVARFGYMIVHTSELRDIWRNVARQCKP